jgi:hypothetical protein
MTYPTDHWQAAVEDGCMFPFTGRWHILVLVIVAIYFHHTAWEAFTPYGQSQLGGKLREAMKYLAIVVDHIMRVGDLR